MTDRTVVMMLALVSGCTGGSPVPVSFPATDGGIVHADRYGAGTNAVVLAHGGRFDKSSWRDQAAVLADSGYLVLAIDFRGRGESRGPAGSSDRSAGVSHDVLGAVRHLRGEGAATLSVIGASFGGGAAAEAATRVAHGEIDRLVLLAHSPIEHPERITVPTLFIVARDDTSGSGARRLPAIEEQFRRVTGPKQLLVVDGTAHAQFLFASEQADTVMTTVLRFLREP